MKQDRRSFLTLGLKALAIAVPAVAVVAAGAKPADAALFRRRSRRATSSSGCSTCNVK